MIAEALERPLRKQGEVVAGWRRSRGHSLIIIEASDPSRPGRHSGATPVSGACATPSKRLCYADARNQLTPLPTSRIWRRGSTPALVRPSKVPGCPMPERTAGAVIRARSDQRPASPDGKAAVWPGATRCRRKPDCHSISDGPMISRFVMVAARRTRRFALVIFMAAVLCASAASTLTDSPPPAQVLSNYENYWAANLARDCGYSQPLPSDPSISLWLFCDTAVNGANSQLQWRWLAQINGSTGAEGPSNPAEGPSAPSDPATPSIRTPSKPNHDGTAHGPAPP